MRCWRGWIADVLDVRRTADRGCLRNTGTLICNPNSRQLVVLRRSGAAAAKAQKYQVFSESLRLSRDRSPVAQSRVLLGRPEPFVSPSANRAVQKAFGLIPVGQAHGPTPAQSFAHRSVTASDKHCGAIGRHAARPVKPNRLGKAVPETGIAALRSSRRSARAAARDERAAVFGETYARVVGPLIRMDQNSAL